MSEHPTAHIAIIATLSRDHEGKALVSDRRAQLRHSLRGSSRADRLQI